jgi:predicted oxidoreductase
MRISSMTDGDIRSLVGAARDAGINFFDHAYICGPASHECEKRNISHLTDAAAGADTPLTRPEWYRLFTAAGHVLP